MNCNAAYIEYPQFFHPSSIVVCMRAALRLFSTAQRPKLLQALHNTYTHERAMAVENREVATFLNRSGFEMQRQGRRVTLTKEVSGYEVKVDFQAKAMLEDSDESVEFQVEVARGDSSLLFRCVHSSASLHVLSLQHSALPYLGPSFPTLDPQLQSLFAEFLRTLTITPDFSLFVAACAIDAEQQLYFQWLQDTRAFLKLSQ